MLEVLKMSEPNIPESGHPLRPVEENKEVVLFVNGAIITTRDAWNDLMKLAAKDGSKGSVCVDATNVAFDGHFRFQGVRFNYSRFVGCSFDRTEPASWWEDCSLENCKFSNTNLASECFHYGRLTRCEFTGCRLSVQMREPMVRGCKFNRCVLPPASSILGWGWGEVSPELNLDLMNYDRLNCLAGPKAFDAWVDSGACPFFTENENGNLMLRPARFSEWRSLWGQYREKMCKRRALPALTLVKRLFKEAGNTL